MSKPIFLQFIGSEIPEEQAKLTIKQEQCNPNSIHKLIQDKFEIKPDQYAMFYKDLEGDQIVAQHEQDFQVAKITMIQSGLTIFIIVNEGVKIKLQGKILEKPKKENSQFQLSDSQLKKMQDQLKNISWLQNQKQEKKQSEFEKLEQEKQAKIEQENLLRLKRQQQERIQQERLKLQEQERRKQSQRRQIEQIKKQQQELERRKMEEELQQKRRQIEIKKQQERIAIQEQQKRRVQEQNKLKEQEEEKRRVKQLQKVQQIQQKKEKENKKAEQKKKADEQKKQKARKAKLQKQAEQTRKKKQKEQLVKLEKAKKLADKSAKKQSVQKKEEVKGDHDVEKPLEKKQSQPTEILTKEQIAQMIKNQVFQLIPTLRKQLRKEESNIQVPLQPLQEQEVCLVCRQKLETPFYYNPNQQYYLCQECQKSDLSTDCLVKIRSNKPTEKIVYATFIQVPSSAVKHQFETEVGKYYADIKANAVKSIQNQIDYCLVKIKEQRKIQADKKKKKEAKKVQAKNKQEKKSEEQKLQFEIIQ